MGPSRSRVSSLSGALFAKTRRRLLGLLYGNPGRSYFANEIVRLADSGTGAVHRELATLEAAGLVTVSRVGNQKHYRANRASPIFEELRGIVVKTFGVADVLREVLAPLAAKIRAAFIYGSSFAQLQQTIRYGRQGQMPAQEQLQGNDKVHLLAAYVYSLSHGDKAADAK